MAVSSKDKMTLFMSEILIKKLKYKALESNVSVSSVARLFLSGWEQDLFGFTGIDNLKSLPEKPGVYFVVDEDTVYYIGQSGNLKQRFAKHNKMEQFRSLKDPTVLWVSVSKEILQDVEKLCLDTLTPKGNKLFTVGYKGEDPTLGTVQISGIITEEQKVMLEQWAAEDERSVSYVMRQILEREVQRREPAPTPQPEPVAQQSK